ncbi:28582_t:CDS:2, partial [Racocetra persica]
QGQRKVLLFIDEADQIGGDNFVSGIRKGFGQGGKELKSLMGDAVLRSGRLEINFFIDIPNEEELKEIIEIYVNKFSEEIDGDKKDIIEKMFKKVQGKKFTGADFGRIFDIIEYTKDKMKKEKYD